MKIPCGIFLSLVITLAASGQQRSDDDTTATDTVNRITIIDPGISYGRPTLLFPLSLRHDAMSRISDYLFVGKTPGMPPPFLGGVMEEKLDLTFPFRLEMEREARLQPLWMVLGTMEFGGVVYVAYRHIKKYGLK